ncbi:hydrogenase/urease maturation nickel metallochaperone HypA [Bauldia sp.]|uniref:hydrogenase/urease maturation nickel metallochaperone HypA n=1 Tax=Bauldia sp. TaxID=2575872 RepID=UPI003BACB694
MHEASLMKNLMRQIDAVAQQENAKRVTGVAVWLGALSHMTEAHFGEHFRQASAGTNAEGARITATLSDDTTHANAQDVLLESVEVET